MKVEKIHENLSSILVEISAQPEIGAMFDPEQLSYDEQLDQIREFIDEAGEYGIAYESVVSILQSYAFILSSSAAVKLLEVGLLMRFKTELPEDGEFDSRQRL
jgi:hypothetical protein